MSEVVPVAPRADVRAPLVMERLLHDLTDAQLLEETTTLVDAARRLPVPWQRLVSAELNHMEAHLIYERFVGVTMRDLCFALRGSGRVLPLDVLRSLIEGIADGLVLLPTGPNPLMISDASIGLTIDGRWCFALGALNHWLVNVLTTQLAAELPNPLSADTIFLMSPEGLQGRPETPASLVSRVGLFAWHLATGGFHPYRGGRHGMMPSITRYTRNDVRVPLSVHPQLPGAAAEVLLRAVSFKGNRFGDLPSFRAALEAVWPVPAASPARTLEVVASVTWSTMQKQFELLKREPMLPIRWDGVWTAARTPEQGIAVLEDQLLERLEPIERLPVRGPVEEPSDSHVHPAVPPETAAPAIPQQRAGLLRRFLALFIR